MYSLSRDTGVANVPLAASPLCSEGGGGGGEKMKKCRRTHANFPYYSFSGGVFCASSEEGPFFSCLSGGGMRKRDGMVRFGKVVKNSQKISSKTGESTVSLKKTNCTGE